MTALYLDFTTDSLLERIAATLDLPEHLEAEAIRQYHLVGQHLSDHPVLGNWDIYPQGSMLLGTVVQPVKSVGYDLDMVCRVGVAKESITQVELKTRVGDALNGYLELHRGEPGAPTKCEPSRRAWHLDYPAGFHMDVLPAIPDEATINAARPDSATASTAIELTDKELRFWQPSNPKAYGTWFRSRMELERQFEEARRAVATKLAKSVGAVPDWEVRMTLQRVVQLLKRHRDLYFDDDPDRPPSILITTLAARAYRGQHELTEAVIDTAGDMAKHITPDAQGRPVVKSPVSEENFADKWSQYPERQAKFVTWSRQVVADLEAAANQRGIEKVAASLGSRLGSDVVTKAIRDLGIGARQSREAGGLRVAGAAAGLTTAAEGRHVRDHIFHGDPSR